MSSYSGINQWLEETGTSDRSADDPWTITRGTHAKAGKNSFRPAVTTDLGAPIQELTSEMQSAEQIAKADEVVTNPAAGGQSTVKPSSGPGFLGGLLDLFPVASTIGKLFGLGGSSSPPPLTPYLSPPSVNFQGAMSSGLSESTAASLAGSEVHSASAHEASGGFAPGIEELSYGENGLPRTAQTDIQSLASQDVVSLTGSDFAPQASESGGPAVALSPATPAVDNSVGSSAENAGSGSSSQSQSILVQVQAMDSQSFMDHSSEIAQAVRQAMLNMHSVNDVIADL